MKSKTLSLFLIAILLNSCGTDGPTDQNNSGTESPKVEFQNEAHQLVYEMTQSVGTYKKLIDLKDVSYNYSYLTPDGKEDITEEKYIFAGEKSYGKYVKHERTLPEMEGTIEQGFDGKNFWFRNNGEYSQDEEILKRVTFNRKTNFYWFTMMQKLSDPGLNYELLREEKVDGSDYNVVKITFKAQAKPTDIYILYINNKTHLVDQFLFTVADFGKIDSPLLMKVKYEEIDGILIPSKRKYTAANWEGKNETEDWIIVKWENIKFNTGLKKELFTARL